MLGALFETLGKVAKRLLGQGSPDESALAKPAEGEQLDSPPAEAELEGLEGFEEGASRDLDEVKAFEDKLAHDRAMALDEKTSSYLPKRPAITQPPPQPPLKPPAQAQAKRSLTGLDLSRRVPSAGSLYQNEVKAHTRQTAPSSSKVSAPVVTINTYDDDGSPLIIRKVVGHYQSNDDFIPPMNYGSSLPVKERDKPKPEQMVAQRPSATRPKGSSRVMRPGEPAPEQAALPEEGRVMGVGGSVRALPPAPSSPAPRPGFESSGSLGLRNMSASQARLSPEERRRAAPQLKDRPEKVESSSYARFWGAYSVADAGLSFGSLLDFDHSAWRVGLSDGDTAAPSAPAPIPSSATHSSPDDDWLKLLGGRFGCFGDAMDRQWAHKLNPKKDAADFAYQNAARFTQS
jgi:hypothetical protein